MDKCVIMKSKKDFNLLWCLTIVLTTILISLTSCSPTPTRSISHIHRLEDVEEERREELKKLLLAVYNREEQLEEEASEIAKVLNDWSEREKRTLPSPEENDIDGHPTITDKPVHHNINHHHTPVHHNTGHHPTTESHIEVLLKPANDNADGETGGGGSDSGGFLGGLLSSFLAGASSTSSGGGGADDGSNGSAGFFSKIIQVKLALIRSIFSFISTLSSSSSAPH